MRWQSLVDFLETVLGHGKAHKPAGAAFVRRVACLEGS